MLESFKDLLKEKGILDILSGDKVVNAIILTDAILCDEELKKIALLIGLNEAVNFITKDSKEGNIETSIKNLIKKYEKEI